MTDKVISTYRGYGHKCHIIRRDAVARTFALMDNRRVVCASSDELTIKRAFMQHVQSIVLQMSLEL